MFGLLQLHVRRQPALAHALAASQVHKVQLGAAHLQGRGGSRVALLTESVRCVAYEKTGLHGTARLAKSAHQGVGAGAPSLDV